MWRQPEEVVRLATAQCGSVPASGWWVEEAGKICQDGGCRVQGGGENDDS